MYYQEKLISGVLCWRNTPDGEWKKVSEESLSARVIGAEQRVTRLRDELSNRGESA